MKINKAMILAAGLGKRMLPLTLKNPKPLLKIGKYSLLERAIFLLIEYGVNEIVINVHHLSHKIEQFLKSKNFKAKITLSHEKNELLDTGGGILNGTKSFENEPFIVLNPDTIWSSNYKKEIKLLENLYFNSNKAALLLVDKRKSFDPSFKGDFKLEDNNLIRDTINNEFIFTGAQILNREVFKKFEKNIFSMNEVWDNLILNKKIKGLKSDQKFYHLNTVSIYKKILKLKFID